MGGLWLVRTPPAAFGGVLTLNTIEMTFHDAYYFSNVVKNVLEQRDVFARNLHDFSGDGRVCGMLSPFRKASVLHEFITFVTSGVLDEPPSEAAFAQLLAQSSLDSKRDWVAVKRVRLPIEHALDAFSFSYQPFVDWLKNAGDSIDDADRATVSDYHDHLRFREGVWDDVVERIAEEVFLILFQNRHSMMAFNEMMAAALADSWEACDEPSVRRLLTAKGTLRRVGIPVWARRAVFFRDRGRCVLCRSDVSGIVNVWSRENYDHIVPLDAHGLNDVTNLQLLCRACNSTKRAGRPVTSCVYDRWF